MQQDAQVPAGENAPRGPIAIVAPDPIICASACIYAALGRSTSMTIEVFRDWTEAERWVATQMALPRA